MPVLDGVEATKALRAMAHFQQLPIIAMTANVLAADIKKTLTSGMNDHSSKPLRPDDMFLTMAQWRKPAAGNVTVTSQLPGFDTQAGLITTELFAVMMSCGSWISLISHR